MLTDMTEKIVRPLIDETSQSGGTSQRRSRSVGKFESWVVIAFSCWGMCSVTMSSTSLASYRRHVCPLLPFRRFRKIPLCLLGWPITGGPRPEWDASLSEAFVSRSTGQHISVVQKALVPDSAHGQAFDQSSYEK